MITFVKFIDQLIDYPIDCATLIYYHAQRSSYYSDITYLQLSKERCFLEVLQQILRM